MSCNPKFVSLAVAPLVCLVFIGGLVPGTNRSWQRALEVVFGPYAGRRSRGWEIVHGDAGDRLLLYALAGLALGAVAVLLGFTRFKGARRIALVLWFVGWLGWFGSALLSYASVYG